MNREEKKQTALGYLFLLPSLAVFAVFMFYPLFYTIYLSFFDWNLIKPVKKFVGLANYINVLHDPNTWKIIGNSFLYIVILLILNFVMPYMLSFVLSSVIKKWQGFYKAVFFLPSVISLVVGSILYTWILNPISACGDYCEKAGAYNADMVKDRRLGYCGIVYCYKLESLRLQFHYYSGRGFRGARRGY